ncbi:MAG: fatty acid cis/trans isomerase [Burkholderiaceae bacterium]|nr:fatty acid cis/trans isomerase [Burkholderiaceae bacterium]
MSSRLLALVLVVLAGCATLTQDSLDTRFGPADPTRHDSPRLAAAGEVSYRREVKPILDRRCVVCHGCYDAPCQLKLGSWEGIARGSSQAQVYDSARLRAAEPTRLGVDAERASQWRRKGFDAVLNERLPSPGNQLAASVLYRALALKRDHPLPAQAVLGDEFDFSLDRRQSCPRLADYDDHARKKPLSGMPYGLPGLEARELDLITRWLQAGAPDDPVPPLPAAVARQVADWERFLNADSAKARLMGRYLYEHWFLGQLMFEGDAQRHVLRIVRSATPPGQPIEQIATRRPYDDPGVPRVYYRLQSDRETLLAKTYMPYLLSPARLARLRGWFLDADYRVDALPSYEIEQASNPFVTFAAIPPESRYRFMLDDAGFFVMNFIKGPVCRGQTALDVIEDRFWVFFIDPRIDTDDAAAQALQRQGQSLHLPAAEGSNARLLAWRQMAESEERLLAAKSAAIDVVAAGQGGARKLDLSLIWNGDGRNPNAALTVFRHFDSASVVQGLVGSEPKTAWVIGYPLLERIYYLLVTGYDVYGNLAHQLSSRLYMDFMRMEGETNFLLLLPKAARDPLRDHWYRGASDEAKRYVNGSAGRVETETAIAYRTADPQRELYQLLRGRLAPVLDRRFELDRHLDQERDRSLRQALVALGALRGASLSWWPETAVLRVDAPGREPKYFSLLRDTGHANVSTLLREAKALLPGENRLTVVPGFIGAYPNAILRASAAELPALAEAIAALKSEADYRALADRFVIRRTDPGFWAASDALHDAYQRWSPAEAALFDYSRLENR